VTEENPEPEQDPAVTAAAGLAASFQAMTAQMTRLTRSQKWYRRIVVVLAISFCLDLLVTAGLGYNTIQVNRALDASRAAAAAATRTAAALRASDIRQCQQNNDGRGKDIAIWNRLLTIPASATAAQKAEVADLERLVGVKDKPRDCAAAFRK
jgi:hypothetical protein